MNSANSSIFFKTPSSNTYLYDLNESTFLFVHPALAYINKLKSENADIEKTLTDSSQADFTFRSEKFTKEQLHYYWGKYQYLQEHGFFNNDVINNCSVPVIDHKTIQSCLANIKQILFEVTEECNLKCKYCAYNECYSESEHRKNKNLEIEKAKTLFRYLSDLWLSEYNYSKEQNIIISFYGGEPLLNFTFIKDLVGLVKNNSFKKNFSFTITTNGLLLDRHINYLIENDFGITISLDGTFENNQYRLDHNNKNPHSKIVEQLIKVQTNYPEYFRNKISFNTVLHDKNSIESSYLFIKETFDKTPKFLTINMSGVKNEEEVLLKSMFVSFKDSYEKLKNKNFLKAELSDNPIGGSLLACLRGYMENYMRTFSDLYIKKAEKKKEITGTCSPFWKRIFITAQGRILPCEKIDYKYYLGQIESNNVTLNTDIISKMYSNYYANIYDQCSNCFLSRACLKCIFSIKNIDTAPQCDEYLNKHNFGIYLSKHLDLIEKDPSFMYNLIEQTNFE